MGKNTPDLKKIFLCLEDFIQIYLIRVQQKEDMLQMKIK